MGAYSSSADSQYSENEVAIDYVGFEADAEAANAAINAAVEALDGTSGTVSDCDVNTVFVKLTKRSGTEGFIHKTSKPMMTMALFTSHLSKMAALTQQHRLQRIPIRFP